MNFATNNDICFQFLEVFFLLEPPNLGEAHVSILDGHSRLYRSISSYFIVNYSLFRGFCWRICAIWIFCILFHKQSQEYFPENKRSSKRVLSGSSFASMFIRLVILFMKLLILEFCTSNYSE